MRLIKVLLTSVVLIAASQLCLAEDQSMDDLWGSGALKSNSVDERGQWFSESKYAMFIHWGLYSIPAGHWEGKNYYGITEWLMHPAVANISKAEYSKLATQFNPQHFDAEAIVQLAVDAGMKYLVITAKHHDGFAMYDSANSDYDITDASPFGRDPMKELALACKEAGIGLGFYYSQYQDWYEQGGAHLAWDNPKQSNDFSAYFDSKVLPQVTELLSNYGPISLIWFDTPGTMSEKHSQKLVDRVRALQPGTLINSRIGNGLGDYSSLGDAHLATSNHEGLWETVDTTNHSWGYAWYDKNFKSGFEVARRLLTTVARGGNYMLNVGPDADGVVPATAAIELRKAGQWLSEYQEAIYGTTASPWKRAMPWGDVTVKDNTLYLHVLDWPVSGVISLPGLKTKIKSAELLNIDNASVSVKKSRDGWVDIQLPYQRPDTLIPVVKLKLSAKPKVNTQFSLDDAAENILYAEFADCEGCDFTEIRWMEKFGEWRYAPSLVNWTDTGVGSWDIAVRTAGQYLVHVEYSANDKVDFSEWMLKAKDTQLIMQALDSGERAKSKRMRGRGILPRYRKVELGLMDLAAGKQRFSITPDSEVKDGGIKLHAIYLTPINK
ncbi:MAG: alpha-L-fucosidase [Pseudomonadales bacterium]|jgi:alpha-L-fucosidase|tara:strand:+ start:8331 stop:10154 length:1824 start_codon:yes stop_codon:yes gene_type:complete